MIVIFLILGIPICSAVLFAIIPPSRIITSINIYVSCITFLISTALPFTEEQEATSLLLFADDFNIPFVILTTFVSFTTSIFSASYIIYELENDHLKENQLRFYHTMFQAFIFTMLLGLLSNNIGFLWVAIEGATLATALMISLSRTHASIKAAWKYFILCGVGIALALFGTTLVYLAAQPMMGSGLRAMAWSEIATKAAYFDPILLDLAFVFLLIGYGTKAGLAPLHAWLPDAHGEGPTPISAILSGLLLNVALYTLLRFKMILAINHEALAPGPLMITIGLTSLLLSSIMLYRRRDIKRLFAYSSIEHVGIATFAFGIGGSLANFAGLLHMSLHSLIKSALFFIVGYIVQARGTQNIADIRGLTISHPKLGWALVLAMIAIAGLPPFGLFTSEFLTITSTIIKTPVLAIPLGLGLLVSFGALILRLQRLAFGEPRRKNTRERIKGSLIPIYVHLALTFIAGIYLPQPFASQFEHVARLLG